MRDYTADTLKDFQTLIAEQQVEIERLTTENRLLRAASEEQRELNGMLRMEIAQMIKPIGRG